MEDFRALRQAAGWFGLLLLAVEEAIRVVDPTREATVPVLATGFLLIVLSVFGPAAAALVIRAFKGGGDNAAE